VPSVNQYSSAVLILREMDERCSPLLDQVGERGHYRAICAGRGSDRQPGVLVPDVALVEVSAALRPPKVQLSVSSRFL